MYVEAMADLFLLNAFAKLHLCVVCATIEVLKESIY